MRILVLSKRQYTGKDLLDDAFGRCYELPLELATHGHEVHGVCASYRPRPEGLVHRRRGGAQVFWHALNVHPLAPWSFYRWTQTLHTHAATFKPDMIWACSDSFHAILGVRLQRRLGVPCVVDLYDNFESFAASAVPGVTAWFRSSVRQAAGVTCVSRALERHIRKHYDDVCGKTTVVENGVSAEFRPLDRSACRRRWGLPPAAQVIGTAGAIDRGRGVETLFQAFLKLAGRRPELHLLLAGPVAGNVRIPAHERIRHLGELPLAEVPHVLSAMDVAVVCNRRSPFGEYCFPQKLYEIIACGVPPLVADTAGVAEFVERAPRHRYEPESVASLAQGIEALLDRPERPTVAAVSWQQHGARLSAFLEQVAGQPQVRQAALA